MKTLADHPQYSLVFMPTYSLAPWVLFHHQAIREAGSSEITGIESFQSGSYPTFDEGMRALAVYNNGHPIEIAVTSAKVF